MKKNNTTASTTTATTAELTPTHISNFLDAVQQENHELHGFVIRQHGKVLSEGWWRPYNCDARYQLFSLSKSFCSTAAGFAVTEGLISLDDTVVSYFPDRVPKEANENLRNMKIRHLLSMNTGQEVEPMRAVFGKDWVKGFFSVQPTHVPGTHFLYNSMATYMVSAIVQKVTGQTVRDYLMPRLFIPLGIPEPEWDSCPMGVSVGGWGLWLNTREISLMGQFLLQKGQWQGKQLLPAEWIETASRMHSDNSSGGTPDWQQGYGFQFWRCQNGHYRGDGAYGQFMIILERFDMVVAFNSNARDMQGELDAVWKHLDPTKEAVGLVTAEELAERVAALEIKAPVLSCSKEEALTRFASFENKKWLLKQSAPGETSGIFGGNPFGAKAFSFNKKGKHVQLVLEDERGAHKIPFDWGYWKESVSTAKRHNSNKRRKFIHCAAGNWIFEHTLQVTIRYPETPDSYTVSFKQEADGTLLVGVVSNVNGGIPLVILMSGTQA